VTDAVIIGAGLGGLSSAIALAAAGAKVRVIEAAPESGGKAGRSVTNGVEFDTGPSLLTMPDVVEKIAALAGLQLADLITLRRLTPSFRYHYPDGVQFDIFDDVEGSLQSVRDTLGASAAQELKDFLAYANGIWAAAAPPFVYGDAPTAKNIASMSVRQVVALRKIDAFGTMRGAIEKRVRSPHLRDLLMRYATYNGSDPRRAPATLNCIAHVELGESGWGIDGGTYALVRALQKTAERMGVEFCFNTPARRIAVRRGRTTGVDTDSGYIEANVVIANCDPALALGPLLGREFDGPEPSMSGWNALVRAHSVPDDLPAHAVWFPKNYEQEFADIFGENRAPREPTVYVCNQARAHGRVGWQDGAEPLFVMVNAPATTDGGEPSGIEEAAEFAMKTLRTAGVVSEADEIVWERTPLQLATAFPGSRGSIYGAASNDRFAAFRRPNNRCKNPRGLYLASGGAHPGGGMPLCLLSGLAAARAVCVDTGLTQSRDAAE
jgi:phytoene desaturase